MGVGAVTKIASIPRKVCMYNTMRLIATASAISFVNECWHSDKNIVYSRKSEYEQLNETNDSASSNKELNFMTIHIKV